MVDCYYLAGDLDGFAELCEEHGLETEAPNVFTAFLSEKVEEAVASLNGKAVSGYDRERGTQRFVLQFPDLAEGKPLMDLSVGIWHGLADLAKEKGIEATMSMVISKEALKLYEPDPGTNWAEGVEELMCLKYLKRIKERGGHSLECLF